MMYCVVFEKICKPRNFLIYTHLISSIKLNPFSYQHVTCPIQDSPTLFPFIRALQPETVRDDAEVLASV